MTTIAATLKSAEAEQADNDIYTSIDRKDFAARRSAQQAIRSAHAAYLAETYAPAGLNAEVLNALYERAWEQGHSSGYSEVENEYSDLAEFVGMVVDSVR